MKKAQRIINYIVNHFQINDKTQKLGKVKLAKILWFADKEYMYRYYTSLTDLEYIKLRNGPVPKNFDNILSDMKEENILHISQKISYGNKQMQYFSLIEPNMKDFSAQEIQVLDNVINQLQNKTTTQLSTLTHDELWEKTQIGEVMPVESVFWQDIVPPDENDIQWANEVLKSKGLV